MYTYIQTDGDHNKRAEGRTAHLMSEAVSKTRSIFVAAKCRVHEHERTVCDFVSTGRPSTDNFLSIQEMFRSKAKSMVSDLFFHCARAWLVSFPRKIYERCEKK